MEQASEEFQAFVSTKAAEGAEPAADAPAQPSEQHAQGAEQAVGSADATAQAAATPASPAPAVVDLGPEEWEGMEIPEAWRPLPLVRVRRLVSDGGRVHGCVS